MAREEEGKVHSLATIQVLPPTVAEKIAAGEVVERPASVVKELVENSIDAGARRIEVELEEGGKRLIRVTDDGCGMNAADARLAFARHATSKLCAESGLDRISTLGFRGEALPSIAAVSNVDLTTRREGSTGVKVRVRDGRVAEVREAGAPGGTTILVKELFSRLAARLKFLRGAAAELGHISEMLTRLALAYPETAFFLRHQGRELAAFLPVEDYFERVCQVIGKNHSRQLRAVGLQERDIRVSGAVAGGGLSFSSSRYLFTYVNRRLVRDRTLNHAILEGFAGLIPRGRQPAAVIYLELSPGEVDVNVHPAKHEVRFLRSHWVHERVVAAVRGALSVRSSDGTLAAAGRVAEAVSSYVEGRAREGGPPPWAGKAPAAAEPSLPLNPSASRSTLVPQPSAHGGYRTLRFVGQVFDGYLVCEGVNKVLLVDQHAAHERVAFERLRGQYRRGRVEQQILLMPETVTLGPGQAEQLRKRAQELSSFGFDIDFFGGNSFVLRAVPALLSGCDWKDLLDDIAAAMSEDGSLAQAQDAAEQLMATIACHSAVRVGRKMPREEADALIAELDKLDFSTNCPHGRPVALELSRTQLERWFGR